MTDVKLAIDTSDTAGSAGSIPARDQRQQPIIVPQICNEPQHLPRRSFAGIVGHRMPASTTRMRAVGAPCAYRVITTFQRDLWPRALDRKRHARRGLTGTHH